MDHSSLKVVYSPQHGTGYVPVMEVLKRANYSVIDVKEEAYPSQLLKIHYLLIQKKKMLMWLLFKWLSNI